MVSLDVLSKWQRSQRSPICVDVRGEVLNEDEDVRRMGPRGSPQAISLPS